MKQPSSTGILKITGKSKFCLEFIAKELAESFELKSLEEGLKLLFKSLEYNVVTSEISEMADYLVEKSMVKIKDGIIEVDE